MAEGLRVRRRNGKKPDIWFTYDSTVTSIGDIKPNLLLNRNVTLISTWKSQGTNSAYFNGNALLSYSAFFPKQAFEFRMDFYCPSNQTNKHLLSSRNDAQVAVRKMDNTTIEVVFGANDYALLYNDGNFDWSVSHRLKFKNEVTSAKLWIDGILVKEVIRSALLDVSGYKVSVGGRVDLNETGNPRNMVIGYIDNVQLRYL